MKTFKSIKELNIYMAQHGYFYINGECREDGTEYIRRYIHINGTSALSFTEKYGTWINYL